MVRPSSDRVVEFLPLTIGAVGHRGIASWDVERVRSQMREIITSYRRKFPITPIILFTALAEGADQIAAEIGLETDGVFVVAILPMPPHEYEKDFDTPEKISKFRSLLNSSYRVVEAQALYANNGMSTSVNSKSELSVGTAEGRDMAYRDCGRLISQQSHVLIAAWDGELSQSVAGTADTITHRLKPSERVPLSNEQIYLWPQENGVLFHILSRRVNSLNTLPDASLLSEQNEICFLDADFVSHRWSADISDKTAEHFEWLNTLLLERKPRGVTDGLLSNSIREVADIQATRMHARFRLLASLLLIFGVFSLFLLDLQHGAVSYWPYFLALGFMFVTASLWLRFVRGKLKDSFYQLRTLTEGMRVQSVWVECGINENPSDDYLKGIPDVSWIPRAMRSAWFVDNLQRISGQEHEELSLRNPEDVAKEWLEDQIDYFRGTRDAKGAIRRSQEKYKRYEKLSIAGVIVALSCILWDGLRFLPGGNAFPAWVSEANQSLMHLGLSISAASATYSQLMAFREITRQYEISQEIFSRGIEILKRESPVNIPNREHLSAIVMQVGKEALRETGTWLALKRDRAVHPI